MSENQGTQSGAQTLIFACAGAAHSGQVANRAGIEMSRIGAGKLYCVAAVGADRPDKVGRARAAVRRVVIDGCEEHCARRILERADLPVDLHVDVTSLGIEKQPLEPNMIQAARRVVRHVLEQS